MDERRGRSAGWARALLVLWSAPFFLSCTPTSSAPPTERELDLSSEGLDARFAGGSLHVDGTLHPRTKLVGSETHLVWYLRLTTDATLADVSSTDDDGAALGEIAHLEPGRVEVDLSVEDLRNVLVGRGLTLGLALDSGAQLWVDCEVRAVFTRRSSAWPKLLSPALRAFDEDRSRF